MPELQFVHEMDFAIPNDYVLICNASGVPNANLVPIYHLGKSRIRAIAINCGVAKRNAPTQQERNSAIKPAEWLAKFARETLQLPDSHVRIFDGDPDDFCPWAKGDPDSAVGWAGQFELPVLANFQGGTTQMSLGLSQALNDSSLDWLRIFVGKFPALTHIPVRIGGRFLDWKKNEPKETAPIEVLLDARGYERYTDDKLSTRNAYAKTNAKTAKAIYHQFFPKGQVSSQDRRTAGQALSMVNRTCNDDKKILPYAISSSDNSIAHYYAPDGDQAVWCSGRIESAEQKLFLGGGWLEQAISELIADRVRSWGGFVVEPNFSICQIGRTTQVNEIDILLMQGELCHLIEVKAGRALDNLQEWGDKLVKLNRILAGRPARSWLCAPFIWIDNDEQRKELIERYNKNGVTLLLGTWAVNELLTQIEKLPF